VDPERGEAEVARLAVEEAAEDARAVEARHAQPADPSVGCDERARVAVGEEGVVRDRRERRRRGCALRDAFGGLWARVRAHRARSISGVMRKRAVNESPGSTTGQAPVRRAFVGAVIASRQTKLCPGGAKTCA